MENHARIALTYCLFISTFTAHTLIANNSNRLTIKSTSTSTVNSPIKKSDAKEMYKPSNTAIIFDIDGVILERTIPIPSLIWRHKVEIAKAFLDFNLIKKVLTLVRMTAPVGVYISLFESKRPTLVPFARELVTTRTTDLKTVSIIEALLSHGYKLHIGTNESPNEFALHQERFPIFSRFTTHTFSDYSAFPDVIQKPQHRYFEQMKNRILTKNKKITHFIFIDDRTDNVQASRETGYYGIDFTTPEALETALVKMDIIQPSCIATPIIPALAR